MFQRGGLRARRVASDHLPGPVNQEFRKIPFDRRRAQEAALFPHKKSVQGMRVGAVHRDLFEERKADAVAGFAKCLNFSGVSGSCPPN